MATLPETWIHHRRDDGEVVGWIDMNVAEPMLVPIDRLGRSCAPVEHWDEAEEILDGIGLRVLMGRFEVDEGDRTAAVRVAHVYDDRIVLSTALTDAVEEVGREIVLPFPPPASFRPIEDRP